MSPAEILPVLRAVARGLHMTGSFVLFGTFGLSAVLLPKQHLTGLKFLAWVSFALVILGGAGWFVLESSDMAGSTALSDIWAALPIVAENTRFGTLLIGRCITMVVAVAAFQFGFVRVAALLAGAALAAEAWLGHGGAMTGAEGTVLLVSSVCHLLSGGAWIGSLPALWLALRRLDLGHAASLAQRFSPIGMVCVAGLLVSAFVQYWFLIGAPGALFTSAYGLVALLKIMLLSGMIVLASQNRFRFTPRLAVSDELARGALLRSVALEIMFGFAAVLAAAFILQMTPPAMARMMQG